MPTESPTRTFVHARVDFPHNTARVPSQDVWQRGLGGILRLSKESVRRVQCSVAHGQKYLAEVRLRIGDLVQVELVDSLVGVHQPCAHGTILTRPAPLCSNQNTGAAASGGDSAPFQGCCRAQIPLTVDGEATAEESGVTRRDESKNARDPVGTDQRPRWRWLVERTRPIPRTTGSGTTLRASRRALRIPWRRPGDRSRTPARARDRPAETSTRSCVVASRRQYAQHFMTHRIPPEPDLSCAILHTARRLYCPCHDMSKTAAADRCQVRGSRRLLRAPLPRLTRR